MWRTVLNWFSIVWASRAAKMVLYFLFFIVGMGGIGVWIPLCQHLHHDSGITDQTVLGNLGTLLIALAATSLADYVLSMPSEEVGTTRLFVIVLAIVVGACGVCLLTVSYHYLQHKFTWVGIVLVTLLWIGVNARNTNFENEDARDTIAGNVP